MSTKGTRPKILEAAERLFASHGVAAVSLREISAAAGVSAGVLHYHFRGRDELITILLERHLPTLNAARADMLLQLQNAVAAPTVRQLLSVTVLPLVQLWQSEGKAGRRFVKMLARLHLERNEVYQALSMRHYPEASIDVFSELMRRCADCNREVLELRMGMAIDSMFSTLAALDMPARIWQTSLEKNPLSIERTVDVLLDFMCAGVANRRA